MQQKYIITPHLLALALGTLLTMQTACMNGNDDSLGFRKHKIASGNKNVPGSIRVNTGSSAKELADTTKKGRLMQLKYVLKISRPDQLSKEVVVNILQNKRLTDQQKAQALDILVKNTLQARLPKAASLATVIAYTMKSDQDVDNKAKVLHRLKKCILESSLSKNKQTKILGEIAKQVSQQIPEKDLREFAVIFLKFHAMALSRFQKVSPTKLSNEMIAYIRESEETYLVDEVILSLDHLSKNYRQLFSVNQRSKIKALTGQNLNSASDIKSYIDKE